MILQTQLQETSDGWNRLHQDVSEICSIRHIHKLPTMGGLSGMVSEFDSRRFPGRSLASAAQLLGA